MTSRNGVGSMEGEEKMVCASPCGSATMSPGPICTGSTGPAWIQQGSPVHIRLRGPSIPVECKAQGAEGVNLADTARSAL